MKTHDGLKHFRFDLTVDIQVENGDAARQAAYALIDKMCQGNLRGPMGLGKTILAKPRFEKLERVRD